MNLNKSFRQNISGPLFDKPPQATGYGPSMMGRPFQESCGFYGPMGAGRMSNNGHGEQQSRFDQSDDLSARYHGKLIYKSFTQKKIVKNCVSTYRVCTCPMKIFA